MIGGCDYVAPFADSRALRDYLDRYFRRIWPNASYLIDGPDEYFVHRDRAARDAWERDGGTDENQGTMIHVLLGNEHDEHVTFVAGHGDTEAAQLSRRMVEQLLVELDKNAALFTRAGEE